MFDHTTDVPTNDDEALARPEANYSRGHLDDCMDALREINRDFGMCSRIKELCEPLISAYPESTGSRTN